MCRRRSCWICLCRNKKELSGSDGIRDDGELVFPDDFIFDSDLEQFKSNPQAYEWTFRLFNSY